MVRSLYGPLALAILVNTESETTICILRSTVFFLPTTVYSYHNPAVILQTLLVQWVFYIQSLLYTNSITAILWRDIRQWNLFTIESWSITSSVATPVSTGLCELHEFQVKLWSDPLGIAKGFITLFSLISNLSYSHSLLIQKCTCQ